MDRTAGETHHGAGATEADRQGEAEYREKLAQAGFEAIEIEPTRVFRVEDAREFLAQAGLDAEPVAAQVNGRFMGAFARAWKPCRA